MRVDNSFFWLDHARRIVQSDGGSFTDISVPIKRKLDEITTVSDCFAYRVMLGFVDAVCWCFPTDGRTFVFQKGSGWGEWTGSSDNNWAPFQVNCHCLLPAYAPSAGQPESTLTNFIGTTTGRVGKFSLDAWSDFGTPITAKIRTGYVNNGTDAKKHCQRIWVALRRGSTTSQPQGMIRYRDEPGPWSDPLPVDFGESGDTEIVVPFSSLGAYRRRQWEFEFTGSGDDSRKEDLTLVSVTEEFSVLKGN